MNRACRRVIGEEHTNRTEEPKLMWVLTSFVPVSEQWKALAYLPAGRGGHGGWFTYARVRGLSRSRLIPEGSRGDDTLPLRIDHALYALSLHLECGYVLYVSGDSTRPVWPLLSNKNADLLPDSNGLATGRPSLPGATLASEYRPRRHPHHLQRQPQHPPCPHSSTRSTRTAPRATATRPATHCSNLTAPTPRSS
jgi:hypothetical protein